MRIYAIKIDGCPVAKPRPKAARTKTGKPMLYTPTRSKQFEFQVREQAVKVFPEPLSDAVKVEIDFYLPRPKRLCWKTKPMPTCFCDKKPDVDNLAKSVLDGLNTVAFKDDSQVAMLSVAKFYHSGMGHPQTVITIRQLI